MKNNTSLCSILLIGLMACSCSSSAPEIKCDFDEDYFKEFIKKELSADSVMFYSKWLKEETYFPELVSITIVIDNPTTSAMNFKELRLEEPIRFENYDEIESALKIEGMKYAIEVNESCNTHDFNDLIIEFGKSDADGRFVYRFIIHYEEIMNKNQSRI